MANEQYRQICQSIRTAGRSLPAEQVVGAVIEGLAGAKRTVDLTSVERC